MEIDPRLFADFMRKASYDWRITPLVLNFTTEGIKVQQVDQARIYFTSSLLRAACDYEGVAGVNEDFAKMIKRCFKEDGSINMTMKDNYLILSGRKELYTYNYETPAEGLMIADDKVKATEYGTLSEKLADGVVFSFDTTTEEFKDLPSGSIILKGSKDGLSIAIRTDVSEYVRKIDGSVVKEGEAKVVIDNLSIPFTGKLRVSIIPGTVLILYSETVKERYTIAVAGRAVE